MTHSLGGTFMQGYLVVDMNIPPPSINNFLLRFNRISIKCFELSGVVSFSGKTSIVNIAITFCLQRDEQCALLPSSSM
jgi:hypothetical protein